MQTEYTQSELLGDLQKQGIRPCDVLIVHSSLKSIGQVQNGPITAIAALQQVLTRRGTLVMPTFSFHFEQISRNNEPYDPQTTPSQVGAITEAFRSMEDVLRSGHPTHAFAAWGLYAQEFIDCDWSLADPAPMRCLHAAVRRGAKVLMIGCNFTALSLLHVAEQLVQSPYLQVFHLGHMGCKPSALVEDERGRPVRVELVNVPGCDHRFGAVQALAENKGLLAHVRLGRAECLLFEAQAVLDLTVAILRRQPDFLLCKPGICPDCDPRWAVFKH